MRHSLYMALLAAIAFVSPSTAETYTVKRGDSLTKITAQVNLTRPDSRITVRDMVIANIEYLTATYRETCKHISEQAQTDGTRKSAFCNKAYGGKYDPAANTLKPGQQLAIPTATVPDSIESTIREVTVAGDEVILIVDITASMGDVLSGRSNIQRLADAYNRGLVTQNRRVSHILGFTGHGVVELTAHGLATIDTRGNRENTCQAYLEAQNRAAGHVAKAIIITDESGDDWHLCETARLTLPVIAHCLPRNGDGDYECRSSLKALAARVPGSRYIEGFPATPIAQTPRATQDIAVGSGQVPGVKRVRPVTPPPATEEPWHKGLFRN